MIMKWIKRIIGFIKLYNDYEYEPEDWRHIVNTYEQVLCNRTKTMSKPTYYLSDILSEMDKWYKYYENEAVLDSLNDFAYKLKSKPYWDDEHNFHAIPIDFIDEVLEEINK